MRLYAPSLCLSALDANLLYPVARRYHKYTGLPIWARDSPMVAAMVPSPDGKSLMTTGWSYASWGEARP